MCIYIHEYMCMYIQTYKCPNTCIHAYNLLIPFDVASVYVFMSAVLLLDSQIGRWLVPGEDYFSHSNCDIKHSLNIVKHIIHVITFNPYNNFINKRFLVF